MWGLKNYVFLIGVVCLLLLLVLACRNESASKPEMQPAVEVKDTVSSPPVKAKVEIADGLHLRLRERLSDTLLTDSIYLEFDSWLRYQEGPLTLFLPEGGLAACNDCPEWTDLLLNGAVDSGEISTQFNGIRQDFSLKSYTDHNWVFTKEGDSLLVRDYLGNPYLLWQTDIQASNGLLHLLKPIDSLSGSPRPED